LGLEKLTGISALKFGLAGNILVILAALWVGRMVSDLSANLSYLVFPIVIWTFFATMIILGQLRMSKN
jgi:tryptophan-rich sensory protein